MRRFDLWLPSRVRIATALSCALLFTAAVVFAQLKQEETVQLPNKQSRIVTFQGGTGTTDADVTRVRLSFRQLFDGSATMKAAVQKVGRNFTVNVVREAATELGKEDETAVFIDPGDIDRALDKIKVAAQAIDNAGNRIALPQNVQDQIKQVVKDTLLPLVLAHETAGLAQIGHEHEGSNGILVKVKAILGELRAAQTIKLAQLDDCRSKNGVATIQLEVFQVELAPGKRVPGTVKVVIEGNVNDGPGQFDGPCHVVEKTLIVNSTVDAEDGLPGDGVCDTGNAPRGFTGICTLRAALTEADQTSGLDEIDFNIPGDGVPKIRIASDTSFFRGSLGALRPVIIDGTTQPGGLVELDGSLAAAQDVAGQPVVGLDLVGEDIVVIGLVINGFPSHGIQIRPTGAPSGGNILIEGNLIGTDVTGRVALPNKGDGVHIVNMPDNVIAFNLISGNQAAGVSMATSSGSTKPFQAAGNTVFGNFIGTDITGASLGNGGTGVSVAGADSVRNQISQNAIAFNGSLEIDLGPAGVTLNDAADSDTGPNGLQNFPVLTLATSDSTTTTIQGSLNSLPNTTFILEFFASVACAPSGFGGSDAFIGSGAVVTDAGGSAPFMATVPIADNLRQFITATAIDPDANTSEFSRCLQKSAQTPAASIDGLISQIMSTATLNPGQRNSLISKLEAAQRSLERGNRNAAQGQLNAFINEVQALKQSHRLDTSTADSWIAQARLIMNVA